MEESSISSFSFVQNIKKNQFRVREAKLNKLLKSDIMVAAHGGQEIKLISLRFNDQF